MNAALPLRRPATAGFTLPEVVIAVGILGFTLGAFILSFTMAMKSVGTARNQMAAKHAMRDCMEWLRTQRFTNSVLSAGTHSISNANYTGSYIVSSVDSYTKDVTVRIIYRNHIKGGVSTNTLTTTLVSTLHP